MISFLLSVKQVFRVVFIVFYLSVIVALSLLPPNDLPHVNVFEGFDKVVHFLMYFPLAALLCWNLRVEQNTNRAFIVLGASVLWGIFMEYMQRSMHLGRSFSWYDELANFAGASVGVVIYVLVTRRFVIDA